jgi:hypothetical protein
MSFRSILAGALKKGASGGAADGTGTVAPPVPAAEESVRGESTHDKHRIATEPEEVPDSDIATAEVAMAPAALAPDTLPQPSFNTAAEIDTTFRTVADGTEGEEEEMLLVTGLREAPPPPGPVPMPYPNVPTEEKDASRAVTDGTEGEEEEMLLVTGVRGAMAPDALEDTAEHSATPDEPETRFVRSMLPGDQRPQSSTLLDLDEEADMEFEVDNRIAVNGSDVDIPHFDAAESDDLDL